MRIKSTLVDNIPKKLFYTPVIGWGVFVLIMSLLPSRDLPDQLLEIGDGIIHSLIYVIWTLLAMWGVWKNHTPIHFSKYLQTFILALSFGLMVEFAQKYLTTYRHFEWADMLCNAIGSLIGLVCFRLFFSSKK